MHVHPPRNRLFILLTISVAQMCISAVLLSRLRMENWSVIFAEDSEGYILAARFFAGMDIPHESLTLLKYRLFSPLIPFLASLVARLIPLEYAFLLLNAFFWLSTVYLIYRLAGILLNPQLAYCCALLFTTAFPLIVWGLPIMVDTASWFMAALTCLLFMRIPQRPAAWLLLAVALGLAVLTKPNLISLVLCFALIAGLKKTYGKLVLVALGALSLAGGVYWLLDLKAEDFLALGYLRHRGVVYVANALFFCFHWGLPLAVWGFATIRTDRHFYLAYLVATFGCYLAFVHNPRLLFIVYPAVLPLVVRGMEQASHAAAARCRLSPYRLLMFMTACYMLTSNLLAGIYLYITRVLQYRSIESIAHLLR